MVDGALGQLRWPMPSAQCLGSVVSVSRSRNHSVEPGPESKEQIENRQADTNLRVAETQGG